MGYFIKEIEKDTKYMGFKYEGDIHSFEKVDLPQFWNVFTERLYESGVQNLTDKKEALGYIKIKDNGESYEYAAACEVTEFEEIEGFSEIIIPKGKYLYYEIKFKNKNTELDNILKYEIPKLSKDMNINEEFAFEFYPEEFDYKDEETSLYVVVQIL